MKFDRHIASSPICGGCDTPPKSICHALVECSCVREIWLHHPRSDLVSNAPKFSFFGLWTMVSVALFHLFLLHYGRFGWLEIKGSLMVVVPISPI